MSELRPLDPSLRVDALRGVNQAARALGYYLDSYDQNSTALISLLADLMNWAVFNGVDFSAVLAVAQDYHEAEGGLL